MVIYTLAYSRIHMVVYTMVYNKIYGIIVVPYSNIYNRTHILPQLLTFSTFLPQGTPVGLPAKTTDQ